jgi:hypothetical protein
LESCYNFVKSMCGHDNFSIFQLFNYGVKNEHISKALKYCLKGIYKNNSGQRPEILTRTFISPERAQQL